MKNILFGLIIIAVVLSGCSVSGGSKFDAEAFGEKWCAPTFLKEHEIINVGSVTGVNIVEIYKSALANAEYMTEIKTESGVFFIHGIHSIPNGVEMEFVDGYCLRAVGDGFCECLTVNQ